LGLYLYTVNSCLIFGRVITLFPIPKYTAQIHVFILQQQDALHNHPHGPRRGRRPCRRAEQVRCSEVSISQLKHQHLFSHPLTPIPSPKSPPSTQPTNPTHQTPSQTPSNPYPSIVDACVSGYKSRIEACQAKGNDFICLCDVYTDVYVCYNNCPQSPERPSAENTKISYCNAALPLRPAASASAASVASEAATRSKYVASATSAALASVTGSKGAAAATPTVAGFTGAGVRNGVGAGVAVAAAMVAGLF
jgi:hypothetical protein